MWWTILGKLAIGALGLTALGLLIIWLVREGFVAAKDGSAVGGPPAWWAGPLYFLVLVGAVVALVKG